MGKILVPVDLSECSENNCLLGLTLAQKIKADIHLLHCYNEVKIPSLLKTREEFLDLDNEFMLGEDEVNSRMKFIVEGLKSKIDTLGLHDISIDYDIVNSYPSREVVKQCDILNPELLLLTTKSVGDKVKKLLGSLTYHIITSVKTPVLSIPEDVIIDFTKKINLCLICDFKDCEIDTLTQLLRLVCKFDVKINLLHIGDIKDDNEKLEKLKSFEKVLKNDTINHEIEVDFIEIANKIEGISEYVKMKNIDIISLTTIKRNFFSKLFYTDLTKNVFFELNKPLLVFHS